MQRLLCIIFTNTDLYEKATIFLSKYIVLWYRLNEGSAAELIFLGGSLDDYKIAKTIKHICTAVTLYVRYKMTSNQLINSFVFFITQWSLGNCRVSSVEVRRSRSRF